MVTVSGEPVGRVTDVRHFGQDLLVIEPAPPGPGRARGRGRRGGPSPAGPARPAARVAPRWRPGRGPAAGSGELLVPFVAAIVPEVDVAAGRLVIDPPPGLLELGAAGARAAG